MPQPLSVVGRITCIKLIAYKQPSAAVVRHKPIGLSQGVYKRGLWSVYLCRLHRSIAAEDFVGEFFLCCQAVSNCKQAPKGIAGNKYVAEAQLQLSCAVKSTG